MGTISAEESPFLWLFFDEDSKFLVARVAADEHILDLEAQDIPMALLTFVGVHYVFQVGYSQSDNQALGFLERVFLDKDYKDYKTSGHVEMISKFVKELEDIREKKKYKKLCVNWSHFAIGMSCDPTIQFLTDC